MEDREKNTNLGEYLDVREVFGYFFRKRSPDRKTNFNLRVMHGINKISIIMFLFGIMFLISKYIF